MAERGLFVAQICYTMMHILTYTITLELWGSFNWYFIVLFCLQEIPNVYGMIMVFFSWLDDIPDWKENEVSLKLQRAWYYWSPWVNFIAFLVLLVQLVPFIYGLFIWEKADGKAEEEIGQTAMTEGVVNTLPYIYNLVVYYCTL